MKTILLDTSIDYTSWDISEVGSIKMTEWQPIETAPKDGTHILAWFEEAQQHLLLWWFADNWRFKGSDTIPIVTPTHWMNLPEPPKKGDE